MSSTSLSKKKKKKFMHYINKTTKIIVNKYHALIFSDKKGETIIGVLVRLRFFPLKICKFEKIVKT